MVVTNEPPTALLMGGVAWSRQGVQGTGDQARLVLKPEGAEVEVTGSATLQLPRPAGWGLGLESAKQPSGVQALGRAEAPVRIAAVGYALRPGSASFEGGVRVDMDPARVTCQRLEVALGPQGAMKSLECLGEVVIADPAKELRCDRVRAMAGADGKLEEIHGDGHVRVSVQSGDRRAFGTAAEAVYRALSNTLELTGEPRVQTADGMAVSGARVIAWELGTRRMRFVGPYQISGPGALLEAVRRELTNALPAGLRP